MNIDVHCGLCSRKLEALYKDGKIRVRPCHRCIETHRPRPKLVKSPPAPDLDFARWSLKTTPARGRYLGRDKDGDLVKLGVAKKLVARNAWLEKCVDRMLSAATCNFITCPQCRLPNADGYVCACGHDGDDDDEEEFGL